MSEVVYETLLADSTPLPPGAQVETNVIDITGARTVNLVFSIINNDPAVRWHVHFGPTTNNGYALTHAGTFQDTNTIALSLPAFGLGLLLVVENGGTENQNADGKIYFIRDVP